MRFDHLVHWVPDMEHAIGEYKRLGFAVIGPSQDSNRGSLNAAWWSGSAYVELVSIGDQDTFRANRTAKEYEDTRALLDAGGGAARFAIEVPDMTETVARLRTAGFPIADPDVRAPVALPDGTSFSWTLGTIPDAPAWGPFFISYHVSPGGRDPRPGRATGGPSPGLFRRILIETAEPETHGESLARVLALPTSPRGTDELDVPLPGCVVTFSRGSAERITRVLLQEADAPTGEVARLRYGRE